MDNKIKLAVVGSRTFDNFEQMRSEIKKRFKLDNIECVISGGTKGADALGAQFAKENYIILIEFKPD